MSVKTFREIFKEKLENARAERERNKQAYESSPQPRYDELFFTGTNSLFEHEEDEMKWTTEEGETK